MKSGKRAILAVILLVLGCPLALAVEPGEMLKDPKLEARARALSSELRCLVCQNESIDESHAPLAHDLRLLIRQHITAGDSNSAIKAYLVARYGDFILLKPPVKLETLLLWGTPFIILICGGGAIFLSLRHRTPAQKAPALTSGEEEKLAALLGKEEG